MNSKILKTICALALSSTLLSCKEIENAEVDIVVIPTQTIAIPAPAKTKACDGITDINGPYIEFPGFELTWKSKGTFRLVTINILFNSSYLSGGEYKGVLAGDELTGTLGGEFVVDADNPDPIVATCPLRFGGIGFNDGVQVANVTGYIRVLGIQIKDNGDQLPVTAEVPVSFMYERF